MVLAPLPEPKTEPEYGSDSPTVQCENPSCGRKGLTHLMINFMAVIGSPGHPSLTGWQCPHVEHWACSRECWLVVAHACVDEHMHTLLEEAHKSVGR